MPINPGPAPGGYGGFSSPASQSTSTYTNDVSPIEGTPEGASTKPTAPGKTRGEGTGGNDQGYWVWTGTTWVWNPKSAGLTLDDIYAVGGFTGTSSPDQANAARAKYMQLLGKNPFGNAFDSRLSYTPFGLQGGNQGFGGFGGGAFGPQPNASDQLTPQLEQLRMQRLTQAYPMFGGR